MIRWGALEGIVVACRFVSSKPPARVRRLRIALIVLAVGWGGAAAPAGAQDPARWQAAWGASMEGVVGDSRDDATYRLIVRPSISGSALRVRLSNPYSSTPATFTRVGAGLRSPAPGGGPVRGAALVPGSAREVTFGGARGVTVAPGDHVMSDPVELEVKAGQDVAVSIHVADPVPMSVHSDGIVFANNTWGVSQYVTAAGAGDHAADESGEAFATNGTTTGTQIAWLDAIDVLSSSSGVIVAFGDSITNGAAAIILKNEDRRDLYDRYTDILAERLGQRGDAGRLSVVNEGINGNTLLGGAGSGEGRLERDVLSQTGVTHVIMLLGANDLGSATAQELIEGMRRVAGRVRARGVKIIGATIMPRGPLLSTPENEAYRRETNAFIRTTDAFDGVVDFDEITRDPENPDRLSPPYDDGDGIHPTPAGYRAMGKGVDLALFPPAPTPGSAQSGGQSTSDSAPARGSGEVPVTGRPGGGGEVPVTGRPGGGGEAPAEGRAASRITPRLSVRVSARHGRGVPYRLATSGRLAFPHGTPSTQACRGGKVSVQVKSGENTISTRRARLRSDCTFVSRVTFRHARRLGRRKTLRVTVRFQGTADLRRVTAKPRAVHRR